MHIDYFPIYHAVNKFDEFPGTVCLTGRGRFWAGAFRCEGFAGLQLPVLDEISAAQVYGDSLLNPKISKLSP